MRTDFGYVFGSTLLALAMAGLIGGLIWLATGSWNYGGGALLFAMYMAGPLAAALVDRAMPAVDAGAGRPDAPAEHAAPLDIAKAA